MYNIKEYIIKSTTITHNLLMMIWLVLH